MRYLHSDAVTSSSSGVWVGSNPTAALVLVVLLSIVRFLDQSAKVVRMNKKPRKSKSKACVAKRQKSALVMIVAKFFETIWMTGTSVAAAMAISTSTH